MWDTIEAVFYILMFLLFLTTFMPKRVQRNVADSTTHLWRFLKALVHWIEPRAYQLVTGQDFYTRQAIYERTLHEYAGGSGNLHPAVQDEFPLPSAENAALHGGDPTVERGDIAPATPEEVQALARALRHNHTTPDKTKSGAIKAGWGLSRSGTDPRYRRASQLYDLATTPEEPASKFPELTPEKKRAAPKATRV